MGRRVTPSFHDRGISEMGSGSVQLVEQGHLRFRGSAVSHAGDVVQRVEHQVPQRLKVGLCVRSTGGVP